MADNSIEASAAVRLPQSNPAPLNINKNNPDAIKAEEHIEENSDGAKVSRAEILSATVSVGEIVNAVSDTALSFSFEEQLHRMVIAVRAVGSDEIIRQFPPEEFISVAKFIQAQDIGQVSEDFLKGILFDDRI